MNKEDDSFSRAPAQVLVQEENCFGFVLFFIVLLGCLFLNWG